MPIFRRGKRGDGSEWVPPAASGGESEPPPSVRRLDSSGDEASSESWVPKEPETWSPPEGSEPGGEADKPATDGPADKSPWVSDEPAPVTKDEPAEQPAAEPDNEPLEWEEPTRSQEPAPAAESGAGPGDQPAKEEERTAMPWDSAGAGEQPRRESGSRVSVVDEQPPRPAPPPGSSEEEYRWHTYRVYPSGHPDAVEFIDTYKAFGRSRVLTGLNMGLPEGMVSMILGPSGTGKSVCIKHMVGLLYPDQGDILVHGESVPAMPDDDLFEMRKKFGLLFQDGALFGSMNLYDNVAFPLRQHTEKGEDEIEDIVMRRLTEVGLGDAREKMPNELSGGMRKRAGFARALVLEPDIVLFDEPDSGLDPVRTALLGELILEIHRDMMEDAKAKQKQHLPTFCVITHDILTARRVADYINVLWKGRIVEAGPSEDMLNSDNPFIRQFLSGESEGPLSMD
jgi:phospholipid/cholesterol/gamma-HCH transport system ATP-binding protein